MPSEPVAISLRSQVLLLRSLTTMLGAGVHLGRALGVLARHSEDPRAAGVCLRMRQQLDSGKSFTQAVQLASPSFSTFQVRLLKVGESSGSLIQVLELLTEYQEKSRAMVLRLASNLTYPVALFFLCAVLLVLGPPFLLKGNVKVLTQLGGEPPLLTRLVFGLTDGRVLAVAGLALAVPVLSVLRALRSPSGRRWLMGRLLTVPRLGYLLRILALSRFSTALALQLRVGIPLLAAVEEAGASAANPVLEDTLMRSVDALRDGADLTASLELADFFPRGYLASLAAGEAAGGVPATLQWLARFYELELESALEVLTAALEPVMMLVMGILTGLMALATLLPLVRLVGSL